MRFRTGQSHRLNWRSWLLIVVEMGIVRANCCNRSASPSIERPDRKFAPRQRPAGDRIGGLELVSQMPHRSAIARLSGDMKN
jgi:hypothetical protein